MRTGNRSFGLRHSACHENLDQRGPASSNRGPSNRSDQGDVPRVLASGIDTLNWSTACGISAGRFAALRERQLRAASAVDAIEIDGQALVLEPHGAGRYPVLLTSREFSVQLTDSEHIPTAMVQLRSEFLHGEGPREAFTRSRRAVEWLCGERVGIAKASRMDVYADVGGWVLTDSERRGLVTHAKLHPVLRAGTDEYQTLQAGKQPGMLVRMYRKDIELREKTGFADHFWGGYDGPVVRVEAEAGSGKLREVGIVTVDDALSCYGNLWRYATHDFCRVHVPSTLDRECWELDPRWRMLQELVPNAFPTCEMVPVIKAERDQERVARQLLGHFQAWAAAEGVFDPEETWHRLSSRYPGLVSEPGRTFAGEVVRHHVRVSHVLRRRHIG